MKNSNNDKILKSSLSTLLKRFSNTDIVTSLEKEYSTSNRGMIPLSLIDDNSTIKKARINENRLDITINTIKEKGINSPLLVVQKGDRYEAIYPRVLFIACKKLKLNNINCSVLNIPEKDSLLFLANRLKEDKNSNIVEMSLILNKLTSRFKFKQTEIAELMQQSRSQITNIIRLIKMPDYVLKDISNNKLTFGHARAISSLKNEQIEKILPQIYEEHLSVRQVENLVYSLLNNSCLLDEKDRIEKKYKCKTMVCPKHVTFTFKDESERQKFINLLLKIKV